MTKTNYYNAPNPKKNLIWTILSILGSLVWIFLLILIFLRLFVFQQVQVDGASMNPSYANNDILMVNQVDKNFVRGQVVAVFANKEFANKVANEMNPIEAYMARWDCSPTKCNAKFYLKRIVGLPGEDIEISKGLVTIYNKQNPDGFVLQEDYIPQSSIDSETARGYILPRTRISTDAYYVLGDNRSNSSDSRVFGAFPKYALFGHETFRVFPNPHIFKLPAYNE
jgi:signal peptidase I